MKIAINTDGFNEWGGGIDFIKYILSSLETTQSLSFDILLPKDDINSLVRKKIFPFKNLVKSVLNGRVPRWESFQGFNEEYYIKAFSNISNSSNISFVDSKSSAYYEKYIQSNCDIILPCMRLPSDNVMHRAWIGYIYDFQHCYYPSFFNKREITKRNLFFKTMLNSANNVIVNANSVISDAKKFVSNYSANMHALPFSPCPQPQWFDDNSVLIEKFDINRPYFLICNQFWKHKDHVTAFKAFKKYLEFNPNVLLICTGATQDYRFPGYFEELSKLLYILGIQSKVRILGHIPKIEQIELIKKCLAVIQPTLFEGGPGGGITYDAVALGKKVLLSDIDVNKEVNCGDVSFFEAQNEDSLFHGLLNITPSNKDLDSHALIKIGMERRLKCADFILNVINQEIKSRN